MVLLVILLGIFEFAWIGFEVFAIIRGSSHATDFGFEDVVLILPFHHCLLSF